VLFQIASRLKYVFPDKITSDCVGPPDCDSNMRIIKFYVAPNETELEKEYRLMREDTQNWHHEFWSMHNRNFFQVVLNELFLVHCFPAYSNWAWTLLFLVRCHLARAGNNGFASIRQANRFDRANRIYVEFDSSVWFQLQKP